MNIKVHEKKKMTKKSSTITAARFSAKIKWHSYVIYFMAALNLDKPLTWLGTL